jgi:hypothetical protein
MNQYATEQVETDPDCFHGWGTVPMQAEPQISKQGQEVEAKDASGQEHPAAVPSFGDRRRVRASARAVSFRLVRSRIAELRSVRDQGVTKCGNGSKKTPYPRGFFENEI